MSAKPSEQSIKKLMEMGYTKSRATKALKECRNNVQQAVALIQKWNIDLERKEDEKRVKEAALRRQEESERNGTGSASIPEPIRKPTAPEDEKKKVKLHPCIARYGKCRYGAHCMFKDLPGDVCLNYVAGNCVYGDMCRNSHVLDGRDIRDAMGLRQNKEYIQGPNGQMLALNREGKIQVPEIVEDEDAVEEEKPDQPVPEASSWNVTASSVPTYSDPVVRPSPTVSTTPAIPISPSSGPEQGGTPPPTNGATTHSNPGDEDAQFLSVPSDIAAIWARSEDDGPRTIEDEEETAARLAEEERRRNPQPPAPFLAKLKAGISSENSRRTNYPQQPRRVVGGERKAPPPPKIPKHPCVVQCGTCRFGKSCNHADLPGDICVFWLNGNCKYGNDCQNKHSYPQTGQPPSYVDHSKHLEFEPGSGGDSSYGSSYGSQYHPPSPPQHPQQHAAASYWGSGPNAFANYEGDEHYARAQAQHLMDDAPFLPRRAEPSGSPTYQLQFKANVHLPHGSPSSPNAHNGFATPSSPGYGFEDSDLEERAFAALREAFPDTPPVTLLHCLRLADNNRHRVADFILTSEAANLSPDEMETRFLQLAMEDERRSVGITTPYHASKSGGTPVSPTSLAAEGVPASSASTSRAVRLLTLCSLLHTIEPSTIEAVLKRTRYNFDQSFYILQASAELRNSSDPQNPWNTTKGITQDSLTAAEKLTIEQLSHMFHELPKDIVLRCYLIEGKKDKDKAIGLLRGLVADLENAPELSQRQRYAEKQMRADISGGTYATSQAYYLNNGSPASAAYVPPAASTSVGYEGGGISDSELYHQVAAEMDSHADWRRLREEAYLTNSARQQLLHLAAGAHGRNDGRLAKELSRRAWELGQEYRRLNMLAMQALEREHNGNNRISTLDLHGFHVEEAIDVVMRRVQLCLQRRIPRLKIIIGQGLHSRQGKSAIFPVLLEELRREGSNLARCTTIRAIKQAEIHLQMQFAEIWR